jgi:NHLM bacteriocin system ABC transporter peptidase/ATP-binding protein
MQMEALECGAACLAMVMAYHGKRLPLERLRVDCGVSRGGANGKNIALAARSHGFAAQGCRLEPAALAAVPLPCIIHWELNHFVVFCGFDGGGAALINDPARGKAAIARERFGASFTGVAILIAPGEAVHREDRAGFLRRASGLVKRLPRGAFAQPLVLALLAGLLVAAFSVAGPVFLRAFVEKALTGASPARLNALCALVALCAVLRFIVSLSLSRSLETAQQRFVVSASARFFWRVLHLPVEFFAQRTSGDVASRQNANQRVAAALFRTAASALQGALTLVLCLFLMMRYSLLMGFIAAFAFAARVALSRLFARKRRAALQGFACDAQKLAAGTASAVEMIETIKASGAEEDWFERWAGRWAAVNAAETRFASSHKLLEALPALTQGLADIAILGCGVHFIAAGSLSVGLLLSFQGLAFVLRQGAGGGGGRLLEEVRHDGERIEDVLRHRQEFPDAPPRASSNHRRLSGALSMQRVSFGYARLQSPLIQDFSLELSPGKSLAIAGPSGCGKSTVAKLIAGLYEPWEGRIIFDGMDRADIPREALTASVALVDGNASLFEGSIEDNLKMWDATLDDAEMILAARDAGIHKDVMMRDGGYRHRLLEGGKNFSSGQRQRFEIARQLARDPSILVLDEATGALDAETEAHIMKAVKERDISCIVIAHRLSTIRACDEIVILERGKIVQSGSHQQLANESGPYRALLDAG